MESMVSVIVPVYNTRVDLLSKCVLSVLDQTFQNFEVIIVDDCSTDEKTLSYLADLDSAEKIRIFHSNKNKGIAGSRNYGIDQAAGEWICFLDHDDYWERDYLSKLIECTEKESTDMVVSGYKIVDEIGNTLKEMSLELYRGGGIKTPYFMYMSSAPWNRLLRREFLLENHIRFPQGCLTEDITFNIACNCLAKNPIGIYCMGYCNYMNADSASRSHKFSAMKYDEMPFSYIRENCVLNKYDRGSMEMRVCQASICEQLTLLVCVFCRDSDKATKINARKTSAGLVRNYMANYIRSAYEYNCHMNSRIAMKIIFFCYMLSIWFHMDKLYCALVHAVLRLFMK